MNMDLRKRILTLFGNIDYVPMRRTEITTVLKLQKDQSQQAHKVIEQMLESGEITYIKKDRLCIPEDTDLVSGRIIFRQSGSATLIPDTNPAGEGYPIKSEDTAVAMHGDTVLARKIKKKWHKNHAKDRSIRSFYSLNGKPNVQVIRILKRKRTNITGTFERGRHTTYVVPDDPRIIQDILVPDSKNSELHPIPKKGDKVIVKMLEWKQRHLNPKGKIIEVLGRTHEPSAEFKAILYKYNLNPLFPSGVKKQINSIPKKYSSKISQIVKTAANSIPLPSIPTTPKTLMMLCR